MRVKEIAVQGFKSFANRHRFVFPSGITAIVGPNGSGKSNVADAIRWVLGEQRASNLRAKRTEDVIFAGTEGRARSGMAQVSITFDNEDAWLDLDFPEVTIGRRASRDGVSQLTVNDAQVRLRDVLDLLGGRLGQGNYTVIGQGMVDSALALRPEDRRALVDEAAGLVPLQRKRDRSLRRLSEVDENLTRVRDILEETGPRLRRLARLSERAARHQEVAGALREALTAWYGHHWYRARRERDAALAAVREAQKRVDAAKAGLEAAIEERRQREKSMAEKEGELDRLRREREDRLRRDAEARQAAAVAETRLEHLRQRLAEVEEGAERDAETLERSKARLDARQAELAEADEEVERRSRAQQDARARLEEAEADRQRRQASIDASRAEILRQRSQGQALRERIAASEQEAEERRERRAEEIERLEALESTLAKAQDQLELARTEHEAREARVADCSRALGEAESRRQAAEDRLRDARDARAEARARREAVAARSDALDTLAGELDESRQVMEALEEGQGDAIEALGRVGELLEVDEAWEAAAAASLGSIVQAIVFSRPHEVDVALTLARRDAHGSLALIDLESARAMPDAGATAGSGEDWTDALSHCRSPRAPGLARALLQATCFAEDLERARQLLGEGAACDRVATRGGLLLHRSGLVTGGRTARRILELERERRALPAEAERAKAALARAEAALAEALEARTSIEHEIGRHNRERLELARLRSESAASLETAEASLARATREREWAIERRDGLGQQIEALEREAEANEQRLAKTEPEQQRLELQLETAEQDLAKTDLEGLRQALAEATSETSTAAQERAGQRALLEAATRELEAARQAIASRRQRAESIRARLRELEDETQGLQGSAGSQESELNEIDDAIGPLESAVADGRIALRTLGEANEEARRALAHSESEHSELRITATRKEDRLERLFDQLRGDEEWLDFELPEQLELGASLRIPLAPVDELPEGAAEALASLRRQMRAIGAIDQEALDAYSETAERHRTLSEQERDLVAAEADLRQLLESLESEMRSRFERTFGAVATAFAEFFPLLFGGGEAELVLEDEGSGGLDIMARPPGKRRQPLNLLSGGERALTAVALIFALLQVSRTPFVVLDEVDAALDEANVNRFCAALEKLAENIQVVIITHNRGTIETAGTVYGVTMAEDGASQIISLRVDAVA